MTGGPSPQSTVTVCVSAVPGSSKPPVAVAVWPASKIVAERPNEVIDGVTLRTVRFRNLLTVKRPSLRLTCAIRLA